MRYEHSAGTRYSRRRDPRKKTDDEKRWDQLDLAWRQFLEVRGRFSCGEASAEELDEALERLKRAEGRIGSHLLDEEGLRNPINWGE
jgi:hypothetical protein